MNHKQWLKLSPTEQLSEVAECAGWERHPGHLALFVDGHFRTDTLESPLPDYLSDLNAMHEAEMTMNEKQFHDYIFALYKIFHAEKGDHTKCFPPDRTVMCATAAQRAEAFVLTIEPDRWQDDAEDGGEYRRGMRQGQ